MKQIEQPIDWKGSNNTFLHVYSQIEERFGSEQAEEYDPEENCFTFKTWLKRGFQVRKGEKALKSFVFFKSGTKSIKKDVSVFFIDQVDKMTPEQHEKALRKSKFTRR